MKRLLSAAVILLVWGLVGPATGTSFFTCQDQADPTSGRDDGDTGSSTATPSRNQEPDAIYIPFESLQKTFEQEGRGVFLPYQDFQRLWAQAQAAKLKPTESKPPAAALISDIESVVTLGEQVASVQAELTIDLLKAGWHQVPLRLNDAAIRSATIDGSPARVIANANGEYELILNHTGEDPTSLKLELEYAKTFSKSGGQSSVSFLAPQAPINRWRIKTGQSGVDLQIEPMIASTLRTIDPEEVSGQSDQPVSETELLAFVGSANQVKLTWTPRAEGASGLDSLVSVQALTTMQVDPSVCRTSIKLNFDIARSPISSVRLEVPADQKVVDVYDKNVKRWSIETNGQQPTQSLNVEFFEEVTGQQLISLELEKFFEQVDGIQLSIPQINVDQGSRNSGIALVKLSSDLRAEPVARVGIMQMDASELPGHLANQSWDFAFRYAALPFELTLGLRQVKPLITAEQLIELTLDPERLAVQFSVQFDVQLTGLFQLELRIPTDLEIRQIVPVNDKKLHSVAVESFFRDSSQPEKVLVTLSRKTMGKFGLKVQLEKKLTEANLQRPSDQFTPISFNLPQVGREGIEFSQGSLIISADPALQLNASNTTGLQSESLQSAGALLEDFSDRGQLPALMAYRFAHADASIDLLVRRRQPQVTVEQVLAINVQTGVIKFEASFFYDILYSGIRNLRIDVPQELIGELRCRTPGISFISMARQPDDLDEGYAALEITSDSEFLGSREMVFHWDRRFEELGLGQNASFEVTRLIPRLVDRASGQIALIKAETIDLSPTGDPSGLRPIDAQSDIRQGKAITNAAMAFEFSTDWKLEIMATRFELQELKRTSISRSLIRVVVLRQNELSVQCLYQIRSVNQRLGVKMPEGFDPATSFDDAPIRINGQRVTPERGDLIYVPLAGLAQDQPFLLELRYTLSGTPNKIELPVFVDDPAVQKTLLAVHLPYEKALVHYSGPWSDGFYFNRGSQPTSAPSLLSDSYAWRLFGRRSPDMTNLIQWVSEGIDTDLSAIQKFDVDGRPYLFSAIRPEPAPAGRLQLQTIDSWWLNGGVCLVVGLVGLLLLRSQWISRIAAVLLILAALIFTASVFPLVTEHLMAEAFWGMLGVVAVIWLAAGLFPVRTGGTGGTGGGRGATTTPSPPAEPSPTSGDSAAAPTGGSIPRAAESSLPKDAQLSATDLPTDPTQEGQGR